MKCLNCGKENDKFLCHQCKTIDVLDKIYNTLLYYRKDICENIFLNEYAESLTEHRYVRDILPQILNDFNADIADFYYCRYYDVIKDERMESSSLQYIETHNIKDRKTQLILYYLLDYYIPDNFDKPEKWIKLIADDRGLCCELYAIAAKYYGMIGDYDESEIMINVAQEMCDNEKEDNLLFYSAENMKIRLAKQSEDTLRYRTKKPYWPSTEQRRLALAPFYDKRGIKYGRITKKPEKIKESDFAPTKECFDEKLNCYCTFWCAEVFSATKANCIYQIAAVKIKDGQIIDEFESLIKPWDCTKSAKEKSAKSIGISVDVLDEADDVDIVMKKFYSFVEKNILVSTEALGNQQRLISRATRYAGIREIENPFFDLLDMAADASEKFDLENNKRSFLLEYFKLEEGTTALQKAQRNKEIYDLLVDYGK